MTSGAVVVRMWQAEGGYRDREVPGVWGEDDRGVWGTLPAYDSRYTFRQQAGPGPQWHAWRIRL